MSSWNDKGSVPKPELLGQGKQREGRHPGSGAKEPTRKKSAALSEGAAQPMPIPTYFEVGGAGEGEGRRRRRGEERKGRTDEEEKMMMMKKKKNNGSLTPFPSSLLAPTSAA